ACTSFSKAYLRHLYVTGELLGPRLCTLHNLTFFQTLMRDIREAIEANRFADFADDFMRKFRGENHDSV
ncbi:MAG: tRNA-guanine transglycosylase, partial [Gammaproteobacteria bacterium]|nr:tRNA-guanine transglycosylase [Gammaproteobacteria bacterium]